MPNTVWLTAVDVDAHLHGGVAVLRRGAHRPAELGVAQEGEQQQRAGEADAGDQQVERADRARRRSESGHRATGSAARADWAKR